MNGSFTSITRPKLEGRQVDHLIEHGMRQFEGAGIYISPSKMSKLVREAVRAYGFDMAAWVIDEYFTAVAALTWESYARALRNHTV